MLIKLSTGEEVIGEIIETLEETGTIQIKNPVQLSQVEQGKLGFIQYPYLAEPGENLTVNATHVLFRSTLNGKMEEEYRNAFNMLVVPSKVGAGGPKGIVSGAGKIPNLRLTQND